MSTGKYKLNFSSPFLFFFPPLLNIISDTQIFLHGFKNKLSNEKSPKYRDWMLFQLEDKLPFKVYGKLHIHNTILKEVQEANAYAYFSEQESQPLNGREGLQRAFLIENFYGLHILCNLFPGLLHSCVYNTRHYLFSGPQIRFRANFFQTRILPTLHFLI